MPLVEITITQRIVLDKESNTIVSKHQSFKTKDLDDPKVDEVVKIEDDHTVGTETFDVELEKGKIVLSDKLIKHLNAIPGDRICVAYHQEENGTFNPILGLTNIMGTELGGNKLTKTYTISFRGKQNEQLAVYGTKFKMKPINEHSVKLISLDAPMSLIKEDGLTAVPSEIPDSLPKPPIPTDCKMLDLTSFFDEEESVVQAIELSGENNDDNVLQNTADFINFDFN